LKAGRNSGFTLIEIIFAVAIVGIALIPLIGLQIKTIHLQQVTDRIEEATLLAQEKMTEKMLEITSNPSVSQYYDEGDFEEDFDTYHWEYTLSTTDADSLLRIDLTVFWNQEDKKNHSITLSSFVTIKASAL
jgi:general secretion pathway protein I